MANKRLVFCVFLLVFKLLACSDGGDLAQTKQGPQPVATPPIEEGGPSSPNPPLQPGQPDPTQKPTVASVSPAADATEVALDASIQATFSKSMKADSINTEVFKLKKDVSNENIVGQTSYADKVAKFIPNSNLEYSTTYVAEVSQDVKDETGNKMAANYTWKFTTTSLPDARPPTVTEITPAKDAKDANVDALITAKFSEAMDAGTINAANFIVKQETTSVVGAVTYANGIATFTPTAKLQNEKTYTVTIKKDVKDLAGNKLASDHVWSFTTRPKAGSLDKTFGDEGKKLEDVDPEFYAEIRGVVIQRLDDTEKILVAGSERKSGGTNDASKAILFRFNPNGQLDTTFNGSGKQIFSFGTTGKFSDFKTVGLQNSGSRIVVAGCGPNDANSVSRGAAIFALAGFVGNTGVVDQTFGKQGKAFVDNAGCANAIAMQPDRSIIAAGYALKHSRFGSESRSSILSKFTVDGKPDDSFNMTSIPGSETGNSEASAIAIQMNDKIVAAGFNTPNFHPKAGLVRFLKNGTTDSTFTPDEIFGGVPVNYSSINSVIVPGDGKIIAAGSRCITCGSMDFGQQIWLLKFDTNGKLDTTFGGESGIVTTSRADNKCYAKAVAVQSDNKIVVAGYCESTLPTSNIDFILVRYGPDGIPDTTFGANGIVVTDMGIYGRAYALAIQSDGKIVVAGQSDGKIALVRYWP